MSIHDTFEIADDSGRLPYEYNVIPSTDPKNNELTLDTSVELPADAAAAYDGEALLARFYGVAADLQVGADTGMANPALKPEAIWRRLVPASTEGDFRDAWIVARGADAGLALARRAINPKPDPDQEIPTQRVGHVATRVYAAEGEQPGERGRHMATVTATVSHVRPEQQQVVTHYHGDDSEITLVDRYVNQGRLYCNVYHSTVDTTRNSWFTFYPDGTARVTVFLSDGNNVPGLANNTFGRPVIYLVGANGAVQRSSAET